MLEDNRLQSLALSIAESGGATAVPGHVRTIELLEAAGRLDRKVEGLATSEELLRRVQEGRGLTRPELAVVLSMSKLALQDAAEELRLADDKLLEPQLFEAFPQPMRKAARQPRSAPTGCATRSSAPRSPTASSTASARALPRPDRGGRRVAAAR